MSFPDPHHPWDPPESEARRINWRDLDLPPGHPGSREKIEAILRQKPRHWLDWYEGRFRNFEGGPVRFIPAQMTHDQVREINAMTHVENELIDQACGRVLRRIAERNWDKRTDVFFTTDHGELQGDFGLVYKGPVSCRRADAHSDDLASGAGRQSGFRRRFPNRSASSTLHRPFALSPACRFHHGWMASRCRRGELRTRASDYRMG